MPAVCLAFCNRDLCLNERPLIHLFSDNLERVEVLLREHSPDQHV